MVVGGGIASFVPVADHPSAAASDFFTNKT